MQAYPSSRAQLVQWLEDSVPRVILYVSWLSRPSYLGPLASSVADLPRSQHQLGARLPYDRGTCHDCRCPWPHLADLHLLVLQGAPVTTWGCRPTSNKCGTSGQDAINSADWCCNGNAGCRSSQCAATSDSTLNALPKCSITVTYDPAGLKPINVGSNKSIVGVGANAAFRGRGIRISGSTNVIVQNLRIYDLNPRFEALLPFLLPSTNTALTQDLALLA